MGSGIALLVPLTHLGCLQPARVVHILALLVCRTAVQMAQRAAHMLRPRRVLGGRARGNHAARPQHLQRSSQAKPRRHSLLRRGLVST